MAEKPRLKQYEGLVAADFEADPVWVQCHTMDYDEPWHDDTDEETFRPWVERLPVDPGNGMFLVRSRFLFADGSQEWGFVTPQPGSEPATERDLGALQPTVFVGDSKVSFWTGVRTLSEEDRQRMYEQLMRSSVDVFPIHFEVADGLAVGNGQGEIPGFCSIPDFRTVRVDR